MDINKEARAQSAWASFVVGLLYLGYIAEQYISIFNDDYLVLNGISLFDSQ